MSWNYLDLADFLLIAESIIGTSAESLTRSDRVIALAESAPAAPASSFAGVEFYPNFAEKAAVLCSHLVRNHPVPDGNKRTAYLCLIEFVERNGYAWQYAINDAEEVEVVDIMVRLAARELPEANLVEWVSNHLVPREG